MSLQLLKVVNWSVKMYYQNLFYVCCLFYFGQIASWFAFNSQLVWEWWDNKPILSCVVFGLPSSVMFWYGTKIAYSTMDELWGPRFLSFGISYMVFPFLTWWLLKESMLEAKTMICIFLSMLIVGIQIFWPPAS